MSNRISKVVLLPFLAAVVMTALTDSAEAEPTIVDYSSIPINNNSNGFGLNGGVQFLNASPFLLDSVTILLGLTSPGTSTFQVIEFDGGLGDTTGTVIGTIAGVSVGGLTFDNFPADAFTVDLSGLELTLQQNVVYGFVLYGGGDIRGGSSQSADTDATIGVIFNGSGNGVFSQSRPAYEIPFIATGTPSATLIDDQFDDGDISTNTLGVGTGFEEFTQVDVGDPSTVTEAGGRVILDTGPDCEYCISAIMSKDSFAFFSSEGARIRWSIPQTDFSGQSRNYLGVVGDDFVATNFNLNVNPEDTNTLGIYIRLEDHSFPAGSIPGFAGGLIVEDGTGAFDELATWTWSGIWDRAGPLTVILDVGDTGFTVSLNGNLGTASYSGQWDSITNATGFTSGWTSYDAVVGVQNQGLIGLGYMALEEITVVTDNPPTADAGVDQSVAVGTTVALSGASSSDDNTPTAALDFAWSFVSKPAGSEATIANPALGSTSFLADMPGDYVVQLIVTDNLGQASAADEMQVAAEIDPAFVFERLTTGGSEYVYTYDYDDGSYERTDTADYHYNPFLREGNVAATRREYDYSYNTATGVREYNSTTSIDLLQSEQGAPTGTLVKTGETPIPGTSNAVFSYLYPRGFVDSKFVFNGSGCGEENGVRRCTGGEFERDLTAGAVVARGGVETPLPVDGAADPLTRIWRHYGGYYWYGRYLTNELWGGSDGRIVRTETYTYEYNSTIRTYTRSIYHRGIYTIDGGIATTVVDNEMQVPLAAPGTLFYYFGSAVIDTTSGVKAFVGSWYDATDARYRLGLFTADTLGTITRILDDNDPEWFRGWYNNLQWSGGNLYWAGNRYESGNLNGAWWSSYEQGIYRSSGAGVEPVVTGKQQYFRDWENRDCGYVASWINTYNWYALPDGAVFNRSNYASDCAVGDYSSTNEGVVWRENGVDYPVVQTYNTEILGTTYRYVNFPWLFGQSVDGRTLAFNAGGNSPYSCTYDATENSRTCQWSSTHDTLLARFDSDRDGRGDDVDNCPLFPNPDQTDSDGNGIGDPCEDSDDDTVPDGLDNCPLDPNLDQLNSDADPYGNACDVCPNDTDDQSDIDGDGLGDACDPNSDADTIDDEFDNCPFIANEDQANLDGDLLGDLCDPDVDGDGIANAIDGRWDGTTFTDQSAQSSRNFSDHDLGGISYGRVLQAANGTLIEDSPDPTRGVEINTVNSSGQTSIKQCDFVGREATLVVPQGTIKVLDCGSINLESLMNGGFLVLDGDIVIDVPTATAASVTDLGDGDFAVANTSETSLPIAMNLGVDLSVTVPSGSTGQVCEPEEGQYEIQNSPDSLEPIVAEVNGVTYVYEPGDIGVPVEVDILPESAENVVYIGRRGGAVDVAILSSAVFDAVQVDLATVSLSGASVKASRKNKAVADEVDVNGDGLIDLLFKVEAKDIGLEDDETAVLTAMTYGGVAVFGSDVITVVVTGGR